MQYLLTSMMEVEGKRLSASSDYEVGCTIQTQSLKELGPGAVKRDMATRV